MYHGKYQGSNILNEPFLCERWHDASYNDHVFQALFTQLCNCLTLNWMIITCMNEWIKGSLSNQIWFLIIEEFQNFRLMPNIYVIAWSKSKIDSKLAGFLIVPKKNHGYMVGKWWNGLESKIILWIDNGYKINKINLA